MRGTVLRVTAAAQRSLVAASRARSAALVERAFAYADSGSKATVRREITLADVAGRSAAEDFATE